MTSKREHQNACTCTVRGTSCYKRNMENFTNQLNNISEVIGKEKPQQRKNQIKDKVPNLLSETKETAVKFYYRGRAENILQQHSR